MDLFAVAFHTASDDRDRAWHYFEAVRRRWQEESPSQIDYPWLMELAGDLAVERGDVERAREFWKVAGEWTEVLKHRDVMLRIVGKLARSST